jgi:malate synthase
MVQEIDDAVTKLEKDLGLAQGTYKIIVQIETTEAFVKIDEIFAGTGLPYFCFLDKFNFCL